MPASQACWLATAVKANLIWGISRLQGQGLSLNQSLRSLGMDGAADLAGYAPHMGTVSSQGPIAMRHVRQDPQSSFSPESAYSQGLMGAPDWHSPQLMMSNAPDSYMYDHSFDLDMWVSATFLPPYHAPSTLRQQRMKVPAYIPAQEWLAIN